MPSLTQLDVVHRLNAPTRVAAARRRRLRKALTCVLVVVAALIAFGGRGSASPPSDTGPASRSPSAQGDAKVPASTLAGRRLVSVPVDAGLRDALDARSRVDVWSTTGTRLVRDAPVVLSGQQPARVLVAVPTGELPAVARTSASSTSGGGDLLVTLAP